jgi:chitin deacetylase
MKNGMAAQALRKGQCVVIWSADSNDWKHAKAQSIAERILRQARPAVLRCCTTVAVIAAAQLPALPRIIDTLRKRGYQFVTVPELLALRHTQPKKSHPRPKSEKAVPAAKTLRASASPSYLAKR